MTTSENTKYGPVEIGAYIDEKGEVRVAVHSAHSRQPNWGDPGNPVPPLVVNGIPLHGTVNLTAIVGSDLSHPDNWKRNSSYLRRQDKQSWEGNDVTNSQMDKLYTMAKEEAAKMFESPAVLPLLRIESAEGKVKTAQKQFVEAWEAMAEAEEKLAYQEKLLAELRKMGGYEKPIFTDHEGGT